MATGDRLVMPPTGLRPSRGRVELIGAVDRLGSIRKALDTKHRLSD